VARIYLLWTQCFLDIARRNRNPAQAWFAEQERNGVRFGAICISPITIALARYEFKIDPPATVAAVTFVKNVNVLIQRFTNAGAIREFSADAAEFWADRILGTVVTYEYPGRRGLPPRQVPIGPEAMVIATAGAGSRGVPFTLVDRKQAIHSSLHIDVHDPYAAAVNP
jgi:hypothetical protein